MEQLFQKFQNAIFSRYLIFLPVGDWNGSKTLPKFFLQKYLKNCRRQAPSKFWSSQGRGSSFSCVTIKIFCSIYPRHVTNNWWKFQPNISKGFWVMANFVLIDCTTMACSRNFGLFWYQKLPEQAIRVQSIRTKLAITQKPFEIFGWNFHQLLYTCLE